MKFNPFLIGIALTGIINTPLAMAGWASGGGQIHKDAHNPWFLENTEVVHYCIDLDEDNFGVTPAVAAKQVRTALNSWRTAWQASEDDYYDAGELEPYGQIRLGTQRFVEVSCRDEVEIPLRFQLGRLLESQAKLFENPRDYVGIAFRTHYNRETLEGAGFVYLAPMRGNLRPDHPLLHGDAWAAHDHLALQSVLRHELGHIFGVPHTPETFMDESFPEFLVNRDLLDNLDAGTEAYLRRYVSTQRYLGVRKGLQQAGCGHRNPVFGPSLFGVPWDEDACGEVVLKDGQLTIRYKPAGDGAPYEVIGRAQFSGSGTQSRPAISVYITDEQAVFGKVPQETFGRLFGESLNTEISWQGEIEIPRTGEKHLFRLRATPIGVYATAVFEGRFQDDVLALD